MPGTSSYRFLLSLLLVLPMERSAAQAPAFNWTDSVVHVGQERRIVVYFGSDKWEILRESFPTLDSAVAFLDRMDHVVVETGDHTDSRGSEAYNLKLSENRARSIANHIAAKGIDASRVLAKGYGESQLLISDAEIAALSTEEEREEAHWSNRRTIVRIIALRRQ